MNRRLKWLVIIVLFICLLVGCYITVINPIVQDYNAVIETACFETASC